MRRLFAQILLSLLPLGCALSTGNPGENENANTEDPLTAGKDARLKALLAQVASDNRLEFAESDAIVGEVLRGGMTSSTLRAAVAFFMNPPKDLEKRPDGEVSADMGGLAALENMYFGMPRNVSGPNGTGQSLVEATSEKSTEFFFGEVPKAPVEVRFVGTARESYTLTFRALEKPIAVDVPAGTTPDQAAALLAGALNANAKAIVDSASDPHVIDFQSDTTLLTLHADANSGTVTVSLDEDA